MIDLSTLTTERRNTETYNLDQMSVHDALIKMNQEDQKVALAVSQALPQVESVTTVVIQSFKKGGRLIYMGAGTSGRLGVLDAAECVPTFGVAATQVIGLIAGGEQAMTVAVEGAEDMTRVRMTIIDNSKVNLVGLKAIDGVMGIVEDETLQVVVGPGTVNKVAKKMVDMVGVKLGETFPNSEGLSFEEQALANKAAAKEKYNKLQN